MTAAMLDRKGWAEYVEDIVRDVPRDVVARAAGVHPSGIGRWLRKQNQVRAEQAVAFARAVGRPAVEALVHAGYLEPEEAAAVIEIYQSRKALSDEVLLDELACRLRERASGAEVVGDPKLRLTRPDDGAESVEDE